MTPQSPRRRFLAQSVAALGGLGLAACQRNTDMGSHAGMDMSGKGMADMPGMAEGAAMARPASTLVWPENPPLRPLPVLAQRATRRGVFEATLTAAETRLSVAQSAAGEPVMSRFWTYNGQLPGPTIELIEGQEVQITLNNQLSQESTVHWHGLPVPASEDGNPMDPVASGQSRTYRFTLPEDCAGTYWYHPHARDVTAEQAFRGLAGALIVRPRRRVLPEGLMEQVLVFSDLRMDNDGLLPPHTDSDWMNGREGDWVLVNGQRQPQWVVAPGASLHLRLINACNARYLRLAVPGHALRLIGTDGGLLAAPGPQWAEILLTPGERVECVLQVQASAGETLTLQNLGYDRGWMGPGRPARVDEPLMRLAVQGPARAPVPLPTRLRHVAALGPATLTRQLVLGEAMSTRAGQMVVQFLINGQAFDPTRIDFRVRVGEVERWEIANPTDMDHPFHVHGTRMQIVSRQKKGQAPVPEPLLAWRDTFNVARNETVSVLVRQDLPGIRMFHCHILEHEERGMMGMLEAR